VRAVLARVHVWLCVRANAAMAAVTVHERTRKMHICKAWRAMYIW
jgi:hypothetical protein